MLFFDRRKRKERRSGKDRRKFEDLNLKGSEKRNGFDRRMKENRRSNADRRAGLYHKLSEDKKKVVHAILDKLEELLDK